MFELAKQGDDVAARELELKIMEALGFEKVWLRCGSGTFMWKAMPPRGKV